MKKGSNPPPPKGAVKPPPPPAPPKKSGVVSQFYIEIVKHGEPEEIIERMGPMSEWRAERVETGACINLNHDDYFTRVVPEQTENQR